jgi:hypothetical protein
VTWDSPSGRSLTTLRKVFDQFGYFLLWSAKNLTDFPQS